MIGKHDVKPVEIITVHVRPERGLTADTRWDIGADCRPIGCGETWDCVVEGNVYGDKKRYSKTATRKADETMWIGELIWVQRLFHRDRHPKNGISHILYSDMRKEALF